MALTAADLLLATRLTRKGRLMEATVAIQRALGLGRPQARASAPPQEGANAAARSAPAATPSSTATAARAAAPVAEDIAFRDIATRQRLPAGEPVVADNAGMALAPSSFEEGEFIFGADAYPYRLFIPSRAGSTQALPLVVMLHGCKQDAADFAQGSAMNLVAERDKFMVLYPEQLRKANGMGCWNWFEPAHQRRDAGEPAMIAELTRHVVKTHAVDASRVYAAGLSAGGAMAALLGRLYPDVYAAIGVHSGLRAGAASNVTSAFTAMRKGASPAAAGTPGVAVPTIVFHGAADKTVAKGNADTIAAGQVQRFDAQGVVLQAQGEAVAHPRGTRAARRMRWSDAGGKVWVEQWTVAAGPHAWSGGDAAGSFTDPQGPSASEAMAAFFAGHALRDGA